MHQELFSAQTLAELSRGRTAELSARLQALGRDELDDTETIERLLDDARIEPPTLLLDTIETAITHQVVDGEECLQAVCTIEFAGDPRMFDVRPSTATEPIPSFLASFEYSPSGSRLTLTTLFDAGRAEDDVIEATEQEIDEVDQILDWLHFDATLHNASLDTVVADEIASRPSAVLAGPSADGSVFERTVDQGGSSGPFGVPKQVGH